MHRLSNLLCGGEQFGCSRETPGKRALNKHEPKPAVQTPECPVHLGLFGREGLPGEFLQLAEDSEEGVLAYSSFVLPAYEGLYFNDLGGFGASSGPAGDGIMQDVATTVGTTYTLEFGLSSENGVGANDTTLTVCLDISCVDFTQEVDGSGPFAKAFTTQTINFIATDTLTTISFVESINLGIGNNDPIIDNVIFDIAPVPIPAAAWLFGSALLGLVGLKRKKA